MNRHIAACVTLLLLLLSLAPAACAIDVGVARIDVTPTEPIRLTGYASRKTNHVAVAQKLWAKALAIGNDFDNLAVLITLDNCGIAESTYRELVSRLRRRNKLKSLNVVVACSHTHSGPCTKDWAPNIFAQDIPPAQQAAIDRYTRELIEKLEQVALTALNDRHPGKLSWAQGNVGFARNRRTAGGPVDHALPVLKFEDASGKLRAIVANYACHCTTLGGEFNHVCGDWAGFAQEAIERENPGAVAMITIGCGADSNPSPRGGPDGGLALARQHGEELAAEVKRLLGLTFTPLTGKLTTGHKEIRLPFGPHFTRDEWQARATNSGIVGYHAKKWLARLDHGEKPPDSLYYPISTWRFGDELALVFLPGEVVVDYALRLKQEFDPARLWVSSYANYVPCYIPSRRILAEGGYEAETSLWYYDRPARISTNAEDLIIKTVHELLPKQFLFDKKKAEFPDPLTPRQALGTMRTKANFTVELVASEPLIESPVAIDWDARGRLWVCEMYDYPTGLKPPPEQDRKWGEPIKEPPGGFVPGGRIKILTSSKGDGHFDKATLFLDKLAFPTGVFPWRNGALICAAPDILYAEDTDGDGRADVVRTNFTGFATHNYQARVNGFRWGLDGWLHGSSGLFGGKIKSLLTGKEVDLGGRDFRIKPDTGEIEPLAGVSQFGRVRDDFDNWFGNDNSTLLWHYPLAEHYMRRNPHVTYPDPRVLVAKAGVRERGSGGVGTNAPPHSLAPSLPRPRHQPYDPNRVFPISRTLDRFNHPDSANRVTSACGIDIYRDNLLGAEYYGNAFICEPVHNLVTRLVLEPDGVTFAGRRADDEQRGEFLASTDNWFRPVQVRTGPDGALWVVDMYRFVIEHPRWIAPDRLKTLDVRAGADKGRIYRVYPKGAKLRSIRNLTNLNDTHLAEALDTANGTARDLVHGELSRRKIGGTTDEEVAPTPTLVAISTNATSPASCIQAMTVLSQYPKMGHRAAFAVLRGLGDDNVWVRRHANRLLQSDAGRFILDVWAGSSEAQERSARINDDDQPLILFERILGVGGAQVKRPSLALGGMFTKTNALHLSDPWIRAAMLSTVPPSREPDLLLSAISYLPYGTLGRNELYRALLHLSCISTNEQTFMRAVDVGTVSQTDAGELARFTQWGWLFDALAAAHVSAQDLAASTNQWMRLRFQNLTGTMGNFRYAAALDGADESVRAKSIELIGRWNPEPNIDLPLLARFLEPGVSAKFQLAALENLRQRSEPEVASTLLGAWQSKGPAFRARAIRILMSRDDWMKSLLAAVQNRTVSSAEVPLPDRQRLLKHTSTSVSEKAAKLFPVAPTVIRGEAFAKFNNVGSLTAAPDRGAALFDKHCAQCHAYRGHGHAVGPNLAEYAGKGVADFVLALLDPNAAINPNFLAYNVETKDGRSLTGIVRGETASGLTLMQGGGVEEKILRSDIAEVRASALSLMPDGLEQALSPQDMADLIAWLKQGAPAPFGHASANPAVATKNRADFLQSGASSVAKVVSSAETLPYRSWIGTLPLAYCRQSAGVNRLAWESMAVRPLTPALSPSEGEREKRGAVAGETVSFRFAAAMGFLSQPQGKFTLHLNGKPMLDFDVSLTDAAWSSAEGRVRMNYTVAEANSEDSNGSLVIEIDTALLEPGKPVRFEITGSESASQRWVGLYLLER